MHLVYVYGSIRLPTPRSIWVIFGYEFAHQPFSPKSGTVTLSAAWFSFYKKYVKPNKLQKKELDLLQERTRGLWVL
jgi:hypothetical protein